MSDKQKEETLEQLEAELARKKKELEAPFAALGQSTSRPRGRPPKQVNVNSDPDASPIDIAKAAHSQRLAEIPRPPSNSSAEGMRDWAEKEIHNLLPEAVASLAWDIKYGDGKARTEARGEILRATGIDKRDATNFGKGGQIVINVAGAANGIALPYLQRTPEPKPASPIVESLTTAHANAAKKGE